jgi:hypothetical protein
MNPRKDFRMWCQAATPDKMDSALSNAGGDVDADAQHLLGMFHVCFATLDICNELQTTS